ncbi:hypothetical protein VZG28_04885 [Synechococcus elongatus IITB4]|uniref:hypothetical protein n=1 Tax=Synechococcus elongatus TaxID=32046 RepID=UPI0030CD90E0
MTVELSNQVITSLRDLPMRTHYKVDFKRYRAPIGMEISNYDVAIDYAMREVEARCYHAVLEPANHVLSAEYMSIVTTLLTDLKPTEKVKLSKLLNDYAVAEINEEVTQNND